MDRWVRGRYEHRRPIADSTSGEYVRISDEPYPTTRQKIVGLAAILAVLVTFFIVCCGGGLIAWLNLSSDTVSDSCPSADGKIVETETTCVLE